MYDILQFFWGFFWIATFLMIGFAFGLVTTKCLNYARHPLVGLAVGMGLTPYLIGGFMIVVSFIPGPYIIRRIIAMMVPGLVSSMFLIRNKYEIKHIKNSIIEKIKDKKIEVLFSLALIAIYSFCLFSSISGIIRDTDIGLYSAEALYFDKTLTYDRIATSLDAIPYLKGSPHNFIWPAYISYALLFSSGDIGFSNDLSMFIAIRFLPIILILALVGTIYLATQKRSSIVLVTALYILIPINANLACSYSRTTFRIIPIVLLITMFIVFFQNTGKRFSKGYYFLLGVVMFAIPSGHAINIVPTIVIMLIWIGTAIYKHTRWCDLIKICVPVVIGGLIGSYNFVFNLLVTGTFSGKPSLYCENIWAGTDLYNIYFDHMNGTVLDHSLGFLSIFNTIFSADRLHLIALSSVLSLGFAICYAIKKQPLNAEMTIILMFICSLLTIFVGKYIGWSEYTYDEWLSRNNSYTYHYYIFGILALSSVLSVCWDYVINKIEEKFKLQTNKRKQFFVTIVVVFVFFIGILPSYYELKNREKIDKDTYELAIIPIQSAINESEKNSRHTMITETRFSYDLGVSAYMLTSYFGMDLFTANSDETIRTFMNSNDIQFICFEHTWWKLFYRHSHFYELLTNMEDIKEVYKNSDVIIYEFLG